MKVAALLTLALVPAARGQALDLDVAKDGSFSITFDGSSWLKGGETQAGGFSSSQKTLTPSAPTTASGTDKLGAYKATTMTWSNAGKSLMVTSFRQYASDPSIIVFEQKFPAGLQGAGLSFADEDRSMAVEATAERAGTGLCRITTKSGKVHASLDGFDAYIPGSGGKFALHKGDFCDCDGNDHCATWAFHEHTTLAACEAKCTDLKCKCMDFGGKEAGGGGGGKHKPGGAAAQTIFPGFARMGEQAKDCFSYHGVFPHMEACTTQTYKESHMGGAPLVIYDGNNTALPMTVFSPLNEPMASHMGSGVDFFGAGVKATVKDIPAGWSQLFILSAGKGINDGMMAWGDKMLKFTGKPRADMYKDLTHSTIGFWTDNGGYYHYATGEPDCKPGDCPSYETVLPKVKAYHDSIGVPFRHWQFDSWFYPKDGGVNAGGGGGAVTNWTADPKIFPSGMVAIQDKLKLPIVMHNRQWSKISDYVKTGCQRSTARMPPENSGGKPDSEYCTWYNSSKAAVPVDPINFFTWFFTQQDGWGLSMYEQDWMCTEYDEVDVLQTNISMGDLWLKGMAVGAASSNRSIQYCMPYANQVLSAAAYPAVTNARATGDYFHAKDQWAVGGTSLFYWAIGILPFKDGFYSSTNKQVGGQTVGPEQQPDREALMATLSCAMVGPMDGINLLNKTRTMTACRKDGFILKPDKPVSTTDACFRTGKPTCHTFHTYSDVKTNEGHQRVHYHFNSPGGPMTADMVYLTGKEDYVVYNWYTEQLVKLSPTVNLAPGYEGNTYAVVSPVSAGGWSFIGETDKYVPASTLRFPAVQMGTASDVEAGLAPALSVTVKGVAGETVKVCAANGLKLVCQSLSFTSPGDKTAAFPPSA